MALTKADLAAIAEMISAALTVAPATSAAAAPKARTFATKAERAAGDGFPCTAAEPCGRADLRTPKSAASHDATQPHWHNAAKPAAA